jgi:hypothetical protein
MKTVIATSDAPAAVGPYSQAVAIGNLLFGEEDRRLHHVSESHRITGEHCFHIVEDPRGLCGDIALHDIASRGLQRDLARAEWNSNAFTSRPKEWK